MRDLDIGLLRAFLAVVESGSMTLAAPILNLTQGAVSQQIKRLEGLLGSDLFNRHNKQLLLTPTGERLVVRAQRLVSLNDETWQLLSAPAYAGEVKLGVPPDIMRPYLPAILRRFNREYPQIQVNLVSDATPDLINGIQNRQLDIALTTDDAIYSQDTVLLQDKLVWVGAENGQAFNQRPLPVSLGSTDCAFRSSTFGALNQASLDWLTICQVGGLEAIRATVEADMAVATFMSRSVPEQLVIIEDQAGLPQLPDYFINLRYAQSNPDAPVVRLGESIQKGFMGL